MKEKIFYAIAIILCSCADNKTAEENFKIGLESYTDSSFASALDNFTKASEKDKKNVNAFFFKGMCETRLQKSKEALKSFQKAIELDSSFYQALVERAKLKIKLGDFGSACIDCDRAKMIKKDYPEIYKTKAIAYESLNDPANAIVSYECAIKYGQQDGETYYKLGILRLNQGNRDSACTLLSKAGELGFMEAFESIKRNCNPSYKKVLDESGENDNSKKKEIEIVTKDKHNPIDKIINERKHTKTLTSYGSDIPTVKIGNIFSNTSDYKLKGISSKTDEHYYQYTKPITDMVYGHTVDYLIVTVVNNVIIEYIYFLFPNSGDIGVPKEMVDRFKKETGFALGKSGNSYGATIDNYFIVISRVDNVSFGGDRILIKTKNVN